MKFAVVDGRRQEAQPGLTGQCRGCERQVVAKCGEVRIWHWAHRVRDRCAAAGETETEWHRAWKNEFPEAWQEFVHTAEDGERHIADVKTPTDWVLEFQHSRIEPEERRSREAYYSRLIWIVDGKKRSRDFPKFMQSWEDGHPRGIESPIRKLVYPEGALLRDWAGSRAHVLFDFQDGHALWWLHPGSDDTQAYVYRIARELFVRAHRDVAAGAPCPFDSAFQQYSEYVASREANTTSLARPQYWPGGAHGRFRGTGRRSPRL